VVPMLGMDLLGQRPAGFVHGARRTFGFPKHPRGQRRLRLTHDPRRNHAAVLKGTILTAS
jgi:hypothetical protein